MYKLNNGILIHIDNIGIRYDNIYIIPKSEKDIFIKENLKALLLLEKEIRLSNEWLSMVKATSELDSDKWMDYASKLQESIIEVHFSDVKLSITRKAELISEYRNIAKTHPEFKDIPIQVKNNRVLPELITAREGYPLVDLVLMNDKGENINLSEIIGQNNIVLMSGSIT